MNAEQIICQRWLTELDVEVSEWMPVVTQTLTDPAQVSPPESFQSDNTAQISIDYLEGSQESLLYFLLEEPEDVQRWGRLLTDIAFAFGVRSWAYFSLTINDHVLRESATPQSIKQLISQCADIDLNAKTVLAFHSSFATGTALTVAKSEDMPTPGEKQFLCFSDLESFSRSTVSKAKLWDMIKETLNKVNH